MLQKPQILELLHGAFGGKQRVHYILLFSTHSFTKAHTYKHVGAERETFTATIRNHSIKLLSIRCRTTSFLLFPTILIDFVSTILEKHIHRHRERYRLHARKKREKKTNKPETERIIWSNGTFFFFLVISAGKSVESFFFFLLFSELSISKNLRPFLVFLCCLFIALTSLSLYALPCLMMLEEQCIHPATSTLR